MEHRFTDQLNRLNDSVARLTRGTDLEGTSVSHGKSAEPDRIVFLTITPAGDQLIDCYHGILVEALDGWTNEVLDRRLYQASNMMLRHHLNKPTGLEAADRGEEEATTPSALFLVPASDDQRPPILTGCPQCQAYLQEIQEWLGCLRETTRRGSMVCKLAYKNSACDFIDLLTSHLDIQRELRLLQTALSIHRKSHSPEQRCRRFAKCDY